MPVVGLLSDTHSPERLDALPDALFQALQGVDLLLHAGDVGLLTVLDQLSSIAPVVAVHGNDDTAEAQREFPYQQVVTVAGTRILLCHTHNPDRALELASRQSDELPPKLRRVAAMAAGSAAEILVFGHWHIAFAHRVDGVLLVNPGAIGTPNATTRALRQTVARLHLEPGAPPRVEHVDLADPGRVFVSPVDPSGGFQAAFAHFGASILDPALDGAWPALRRDLGALMTPEAAYHLVLPVARRVWRGQQQWIRLADLIAAAEADPAVPPEALARLRSLSSPSGRG